MRLSQGHFYRNKGNIFICTAADWNHLGDNQVQAHTLQGFKWVTATSSTILGMKLPYALPLSLHLNWKMGPAMYEIKTSNCNIIKLSADVSRLYFLTYFHFQFKW